MAISKRLRFEVFKRDGFRCRYCGATVLAAVLHCDHVIPESKGGPTEAANLVTACVDCNLGKSNVPLDQRKLDPSVDIDAAKEHAEQIKAYLKVQKTIASTKRELETLALQHWEDRMGDWHYTLPRYLTLPLKEFGLAKVNEAIDVVAAKGISNKLSQVRYFCGVIRNWRNPNREKHSAIAEIKAANAATAASVAIALGHYCVYRLKWEWNPDLLPAFEAALTAQVSVQDIYRAIDSTSNAPNANGTPQQLLADLLEHWTNNPAEIGDDNVEWVHVDEVDNQCIGTATDALMSYWWHRHGKRGPSGLSTAIATTHLWHLHPDRYAAVDQIESTIPNASDEEKVAAFLRISRREMP
jgi:hypothetical protein